MKDLFLKVMVACAAITAFAGGGAAIINGANTLVETKVNTAFVQKEQARLAAEEASSITASEVAGALVKGTNKLLK
jgi:hypothetical protein